MKTPNNTWLNFRSFSALALVGQLGLGVALPIVICTLLGTRLDKWLQTRGLITIFAILFGVASGIYSGYRILKKEMPPNNKQEKNNGS
jgi:hypothetical protein